MSSYRLHCDSCEALAVNGTPTHETGCRRAKEPWTKRRGGIMCPKFCDTPSWAEPKKPKPKSKELPNSYKCPQCGKEHLFDIYVFAHWTMRLVTTCDNCHRKTAIQRGKVVS